MSALSVIGKAHMCGPILHDDVERAHRTRRVCMPHMRAVMNIVRALMKYYSIIMKIHINILERVHCGLMCTVRQAYPSARYQFDAYMINPMRG